MLYNEENRNGRWYGGETIGEEESAAWYPQESAGSLPEESVLPEAAAEDAPAYFTPAAAGETGVRSPAYFTPAAAQPAVPKSHKGLIAAAIIVGVLLYLGFITLVVAGFADLFGFNGHVTVTEGGPDFFDDFDFDSDSDLLPSTAEDFFESYYTGSSDILLPKADPDPRMKLTLQDAAGPELALTEIYRKLNPAVVGILCYRDGEEFSWGTGVIFTSDGYIITNTHVLENADRAEILFSDDTRCDALLVGSDSATDLAVLKIEATGLPVAPFADSAQCEVGETVVAIGNPLGQEYSGTMTQGILSAIDRAMSVNGYPLTLMQTDAALNEGNSGGPLINSRGQVIGITSMKLMFTYSAPVEGIGFAIPSSVIERVVNSILQNGAVLGQPTLGITAGSIPDEAKANYDLPDGIFVSAVDERSDAWAQGLRPGDVITAVEGTPVTTVNEVNAIKSGFAVGDDFTVSVWRDGKEFDVTFKLIDKTELN